MRASPCISGLPIFVGTRSLSPCHEDSTVSQPYPTVTCGTLPAPMDLPLDWSSGCSEVRNALQFGMLCILNLLPRGACAGFQAPSATAVTCDLLSQQRGWG